MLSKRWSKWADPLNWLPNVIYFASLNIEWKCVLHVIITYVNKRKRSRATERIVTESIVGLKWCLLHPVIPTLSRWLLEMIASTHFSFICSFSFKDFFIQGSFGLCEPLICKFAYTMCLKRKKRYFFYLKITQMALWIYNYTRLPKLTLIKT